MILTGLQTVFPHFVVVLLCKCENERYNLFDVVPESVSGLLADGADGLDVGPRVLVGVGASRSGENGGVI